MASAWFTKNIDTFSHLSFLLDGLLLQLRNNGNSNVQYQTNHSANAIKLYFILKHLKH